MSCWVCCTRMHYCGICICIKFYSLTNDSYRMEICCQIISSLVTVFCRSSPGVQVYIKMMTHSPLSITSNTYNLCSQISCVCHGSSSFCENSSLMWFCHLIWVWGSSHGDRWSAPLHWISCSCHNHKCQFRSLPFTWSLLSLGGLLNMLTAIIIS